MTCSAHQLAKLLKLDDTCGNACIEFSGNITPDLHGTEARGDPLPSMPTVLVVIVILQDLVQIAVLQPVLHSGILHHSVAP
jgi:hypothetical protein